MPEPTDSQGAGAAGSASTSGAAAGASQRPPAAAATADAASGPVTEAQAPAVKEPATKLYRAMQALPDGPSGRTTEFGAIFRATANDPRVLSGKCVVVDEDTVPESVRQALANQE